MSPNRVNPAILLARVKVHLENKAARDSLKGQNSLLESEVKRRTHEIIDTQHATILLLAAIVGTRDKETGNHIRRTQHYVRLLATRLRDHPAFAEYLTDEQIEILFESRASARHRQGRDSRSNPIEAGQVRSRRIRDHEDPTRRLATQRSKKPKPNSG